MSKTIHMCIDLRGVLNWPKREFSRLFKGACRDDNGQPMSVDEVRDSFYDELAKGRKVIPIGTCDNFDYQTGCLGHDDGALILGDKPIEMDGGLA